MRPSSLSGRLLLSAFASVLVAGVAAAILLGALVFLRDANGLIDAKLEKELDALAQGLRSEGGRLVLQPAPLNWDMYDALRRDTAFRIVDADGRTVFGSFEGPALRALERAAPGAATLDVAGEWEPVKLRVRERSVDRAGARYTIQVARSYRFVTRLAENDRELYLGSAVASLSFALAVFALVVYLNVRRVMAPLLRASAIAAGIGPRSLSARLRIDGMPSEMAPLIKALNSALERLERGYRVQQDFLATAAHELKTPLALLQAEIELGRDAGRSAMLRETRLMARQVNQLLHLAEVSEAGNFRFCRCSLWALSADAVDYLARLAERRRLSLRVERSGAEPWVDADEGAVFMLLRNLLENAMKHSPDGGTVTLQVSPRALAVTDEGSGVRPEHREHLFERFWHAPNVVDGAGLGLSIVREICVAHGWSVRFEEAEGGGARFVVALGTARTRGDG